MLHDAIIIGGSYSGMAAALQLARARRQVLIVDAGQRRNRFTEHSHGFLTQDGAPPGAIAERAREQLLRYPTVTWIEGTVTAAALARDGFEVKLEAGERHGGRRLVLATGVADELPELPGLRERWGTSVFLCPYCDGYELAQGHLGVLATGEFWFHQAMLIPEWGRTTLFTNGIHHPNAEQRTALAARGVSIEETPVLAVVGRRARMELEDGRSIPLMGLFLVPRTRLASEVADGLGCALEQGPMGAFIRTDARKQTSVPGVFACGDASRAAGSVSLAVGDGAMAGTAVHQSLVFG
ncbi:NAD(P)/FAD-dependent oxidoreductase [Teichococcus vastitatis]|uniref:Thioredoxin reductase n=1 Tax=Teichococcus vastitatis TaxID=2307076 RepID=A0ABS9W6Y7_9PROT|nr:NAD(P)/FAD-dependent oxidoreductase [Pseudoroseomonas vastitatis]MCI0755061.1 NAD(P)/FAD-dependent oxidoreductase [Pseudoroseomonas vastitatis]